MVLEQALGITKLSERARHPVLTVVSAQQAVGQSPHGRRGRGAGAGVGHHTVFGLVNVVLVLFFGLAVPHWFGFDQPATVGAAPSVTPTPSASAAASAAAAASARP